MAKKEAAPKKAAPKKVAPKKGEAVPAKKTKGKLDEVRM